MEGDRVKRKRGKETMGKGREGRRRWERGEREGDDGKGERGKETMGKGREERKWREEAGDDGKGR